MAHHAELVSVKVAEVRTVVVRVIVRPKAWRSFIFAAGCHGRLMNAINCGSIGSHECSHLAVAGSVRTSIKWPPDDE